jgi:pyruvate dehydrogenase (quinone)
VLAVGRKATCEDARFDGVLALYAIAAKLAMPERLVVALAGDGAIADARHQRARDPEPSVAVVKGCVCRSSCSTTAISPVSWEQRETEGAPRWPTSRDLPGFPYAGYAQSLGLGCMGPR